MIDHLVQICEFKALWDTWRTTERHFVSGADFMLLEKRAHDLLSHDLTLEKAVADLHEMMPVATCGYPFGDFLWNQVGSVTSSFTKGTMSAVLPAPGIAREHLSGFQLDLLSAHGNSGGPIFDPATGKVFGVLKGGPVDPKGNPILGITTAELWRAPDQFRSMSGCYAKRCRHEQY